VLTQHPMLTAWLAAAILLLGLIVFSGAMLRLFGPWFSEQLSRWKEVASLDRQGFADLEPEAGASLAAPNARSARQSTFGSEGSMRIRRVSRKRLRELEAATPDLLSFLARALRAGHSLHAAIHWAGESFPGPLGEEFARISAQMRFGVAMHQALEGFVSRHPLGELRLFAAGLRIAEELGGPLPALLEQLARQTRLRLRLRARVKALSAEARWSAWFLGLLPFILALILGIWRPEHMAVLWLDRNGQALVAAALVLMAVGALWMKRLVARVEG